MKPKPGFFKKLLIVTGLGLLIPLIGMSMDKIADEDRTLSPYFLVQSDQPDVDRLPLKSTKADVTVSGIIADVTVTQVYKNEGDNKLEAIYVFPASTRAAVYAMTMKVGKRVIVAEIQTKQKARETYEQALQEGKTASLLQQHRPNVFQMNVGNILPGDEIRVELKYTEALVPEDSIYEFVYPTVVGPRFANQSETPASDKWVNNPYLKEGKDAPFTFAFDLSINGGMPISKIYSPSHDIDVEYSGQKTAHVSLKESNKTNNRDVIIRYGLAGNKIESGLLLNQGEKENFFLLMVEPPKRVTTDMIVPREYIFIVDVSGSMHGVPIQTAQYLMEQLSKNLRPIDTFNVMMFSGGNKVVFKESVQATPDNIKKAQTALNNEHGSGSTQLMKALKAAMDLPKAEYNLSRNFIIITDGYVAVEKEAFEYIRGNLNKGNVFAYGIGSSVNRYIIEGMARAGMGEAFIVPNRNEDEARKKAALLKTYIESPVLTDVKVNYKGFKVSDVEPASIPDLFAKKPVMVFGKFKGRPCGQIIITGKTAGKEYRQVIDVKEQGSAGNEALRYLWARHRIMRLADMNKLDPSDKRVDEVTGLGLKYNLLTDYTSFVAVDKVKRTDGKAATTVEQPLPLPQDVTDHAVGSNAYQAAGSMAAPKRLSHSIKYKSGRSSFLDLGMTKAAAPVAMEAAADEAIVEKEESKQSDKLRLSAYLVIKVAKGDLKQPDAEKVLRQLQQKLTRLAKKTGRKGMMVIEFHINSKGEVEKITIKRDQLKDKKMIKLVKKESKHIRFPKPTQGAVVQLIVKVQ